MSIASEITRLQEAKADIKTAIENKGVTVPASATLDEYASLVDSISGGGSVDWESTARGMLDCSTTFELPTDLTVKGSSHILYLRKNVTGHITISDTSIGTAAFSNCTNISSITISDGMTSIGNEAFRNCTGLTELIIPDSVTSIGESICHTCSYLKKVIIGSSVSTIGQYAFTNCINIEEMIFRGAVPPTLRNVNNSLGSSSYTYPFYVPDESVNDYKSAASWTNYASRVKGISERPTS